ncbi:MAG: hypothetical protein JWQ42_136 [Edaphobacter sp.]|nr:hypothetical protein [Edaphobacter sp.]
MRRSSVVLAMFLVSVGLPAQTNSRTPPVQFMEAPAQGGCPAGFSVERRSTLNVVETKGAAERRQRQGLEVKLGQKDAAGIVSADVTVHGYSAKRRVMPTVSGAEPDASESFRIAGEAASLLIKEIWMHRVNTVSWVELNEVEYANGFVWHSSAKARCSAVPSKLLLVAGAR